MRLTPLFLSGGLAALLASCGSLDSGNVGTDSETVIENDLGDPVCAVHGTPIILTQGYRIARVEPLPQDSSLRALEERNPNFLPPEWSLDRSDLYRYPGPVEYCQACQRALEHELKLSYQRGGIPAGNSVAAGSAPGPSGIRYAPGVAGSLAR